MKEFVCTVIFVQQEVLFLVQSQLQDMKSYSLVSRFVKRAFNRNASLPKYFNFQNLNDIPLYYDKTVYNNELKSNNLHNNLIIVVSLLTLAVVRKQDYMTITEDNLIIYDKKVIFSKKNKTLKL